MMLIVGGMRDPSVGTDSLNYMRLFNQSEVDISSLTHANEPLYMLIMFLMIITGWGYEGLQFLCMAIILIGLFFVVSKWSDWPLFSILCYVLLYYFFYSFNTVRQYLAIPFVLMFFYYLNHQMKKKSLICIVLAALFHYYAIIAILAFLLYRWKLTKEMMIIMMMSTFMIGATPVVQSLALRLSHYSTYLAYYAQDSSFYRESLFSFSRLLLNIYAILLILWLYNKDSMLTILVFGICFLNIFAFNPSLGRLAQYFTIIQIIIIPSIPKTCKNKSMVKMVSICSLLYMIITWAWLIKSNAGEVVPWIYGGF
jgi:hypothetical protein